MSTTLLLCIASVVAVALSGYQTSKASTNSTPESH